jgi:tetratricopeptide (TPR) repeat protein
MVRAGVALALLSGAASAHGAHRFVFTAYGDAPGGAQVLAGRYRAALEDVKNYGGIADHDPAATNTNRCVAYSMTLSWREARAACDAAVRAAGEESNGGPGWTGAVVADEERLAIAYANRAVMHWMSNDQAAARRDLRKALALSPKADFVARNVAALDTHRNVALAEATAPKS